MGLRQHPLFPDYCLSDAQDLRWNPYLCTPFVRKPDLPGGQAESLLFIHFLTKNRDHEQLRIDGDFYPCAV
jgi:hypothetical protein